MYGGLIRYMGLSKSYKIMTLHELLDERNRVLWLIKNASYSNNPAFTIRQNKKYLERLEKKIKEII